MSGHSRGGCTQPGLASTQVISNDAGCAVGGRTLTGDTHALPITAEAGCRLAGGTPLGPSGVSTLSSDVGCELVGITPPADDTSGQDCPNIPKAGAAQLGADGFDQEDVLTFLFSNVTTWGPQALHYLHPAPHTGLLIVEQHMKDLSFTDMMAKMKHRHE